MHSKTFIDLLKKRLDAPLPGKPAHLQMIPSVRLPDYEKGYDLTSARKSSVLLLLCPDNDNLFIPFIQRPVYEGVHSGQISFPGGKAEPEDHSPEDTALREAFEEIGIDRQNVQVVGRLSPVYIPPSHFLVNVIIGYYGSVPAFIKSDMEVDEIFNVPVHSLLDDLYISSVPVTNSQGLHFEAPCFKIDGKIIWGATAMMLSEFRWILKELNY